MVVIDESSNSSSDEEDRRLRPPRTSRINVSSLRVIESSARPEGIVDTPSVSLTKDENPEYTATEAESSQKDIPASLVEPEHTEKPAANDSSQDFNLNFCEDLLAKIIEDVMHAIPQLLASHELEMGLKSLKKSQSHVPNKLTSFLGHGAQNKLSYNSCNSIYELCAMAPSMGLSKESKKPLEFGNAIQKDSFTGAVRESVINENDQIKDVLKLNCVK